jgi:hypothetical protein
MVVGEGGTILRTTDGGITWTKQSSGGGSILRSVFLANANIGTVVGDGGIILRTTSGGDVVSVESKPLENSSSLHEYKLDQNFPNPFNPTTNISFDLPSKSFVSLKVFDLLGREVAVLLSEEVSAGRYVRQWNALSLPSGIYFYRLEAGLFVETKKAILLR